MFSPLTSRVLSNEDNILPVVKVAVSLSTLGGEVNGVTSEEEVVLGGDGEGIAHEGTRVDNKGAGHLAGDAVCRVSRLFLAIILRGEGNRAAPGRIRGWKGGRAYISGSFWVSITAATGIPKLETGPQKSGKIG